MRTEVISYNADGLKMDGHLFYDETKSGKRPGVLVYPEAFGLGEHAKGRAERLAKLGYVAFACDLHGEGKMINDLPTVMPILNELRAAPQRTRDRAGKALEVLKKRAEVDPSKIAAIGYCFGGTMALELARSGADVAAVVGFHSGLATIVPQDAKNIKGRVLVCIGADDPGIQADQRADFEKEMREANVDWEMNLYGGVVHSFTDPGADKRNMPKFARYDAKADARSWAEMQRLFGEVFN
jgi:dienelactone hydrolase